MYTIDRKEMKVADSRSDSSELPSVEVPEAVTETTFATIPNPSVPISSGYTVDDQGLLNNYAILTPMYIEEPTLPTAEERLRSKSQVVFAILLTAMAIFIALIVS
ncbi:hypothetical protein PseudUWO311_14315 [Pseudanabaena sp. UWO311]|uniref:hypothetical protein n=1 Tax=Pseudanabaena sp. UWO311 TaxID=2487337 RepID=UPI00115A5BAA|nr:hypothetical protein [Pseudanabaena sp. UWO311]TYQ25867.1 hypothetical protein PseudUWO311_14315 [Pseudanabaena sp. UWO311]